MGQTVHNEEYAALAELRYRIRRFLRASDESARAARLEPQQYQMLLAIRGLPEGQEATIRRLADQLLLRHHSAVGLVDRLETRGYIQRHRSRKDRREVLVTLSPRGGRALERVALRRLEDLRESGHALVAAIGAILRRSRKESLAAPRRRVTTRSRRGGRR